MGRRDTQMIKKEEMLDNTCLEIPRVNIFKAEYSLFIYIYRVSWWLKCPDGYTAAFMGFMMITLTKQISRNCELVKFLPLFSAFELIGHEP